MTAPTTQADIDRALDETTKLQRRAADPTASVWVSANAGTGKTHVLTNRVLRLLLSGTKPERILCVTYTKAAAAVMSKRVFDRLADWVMKPQDELRHTLEELTGGAVQNETCDFARTLFTSAIETPGGLKVLTIHGFCERLLQRFPLEAGIAPGFAILDEKKSNALIREAIDRVLVRATTKPESALGRALSTAIAYASDVYFDEILSDALTHRQWLQDMHRLQSHDPMGKLTSPRALFNHHFQLDDEDTEETIAGAIANVLTDADLVAAREALETGSKNDIKAAERLVSAHKAHAPGIRADAMIDVFLTGTKSPRKSLMTKALSGAFPAVLATLEGAQARVVQLYQKRIALRIREASEALYAIADAVMQDYTKAKARQSALDFPDLIDKAVGLLNSQSNAEWVLFKLDEGLSHILIDESQDTSPEQWQLVSALSREFFTGLGASDETRTVFAVGDEKQSIYSFQGADPREFASQGERFKRLANDAKQNFYPVPLTLSFRTTEPVLNAVDHVFADPARTTGLSSTGAHVEHAAKRLGQAGVVELWPPETSEASDDADPWHPLSAQSQSDPVATLANRIAQTLSDWFQRGATLASTGKPIRPGDVLILVRKRRPFAPAMVSALKSLKIPVAGADRIKLLEQIAVRDVMALGDFLTLPEDDLSLAEVLKSPIFAFDDEDLIALAPGRGRRTLWKALLDAATTDNPRYATAADTLKRWRKLADFAPPYEFFARLFDVDKVRDKLISRLGPDAGEALDEFIGQALQFDEQEPPSLSGFLAWLRATGHEVKRDLEMERDEVRVMTVHGAKGLEAPIVFLPDTCSAPATGKLKTVVSAPTMARPDGVAAPFIWTVKDASHHSGIQEVKAEHKRLEQEESHRLLYVAMTRARDRLYIGGFERGNGKRDGQCWYNLIETGLNAHLEDAEDDVGRPIKRIATPQTAKLEQPAGDANEAIQPEPHLDWAKTPAAQEPQLSIPLAPSQLAPYDTDEEGEPSIDQPPPDQAALPPVTGPMALGSDYKFLRGNLTHALLQHLPNFAPDKRQRIGEDFVDARGAELPPGARASIVTETLTILDNPAFAPLFGAKSRAEVPIVAVLKRPPNHDGPDIRLNGAIDRLADLGDSIFVVDFKTNRRPPIGLDEVSDAYLYQLASYRLALTEIYPGKPIRAALLWTDGPKIMEIPSTILDVYQEKLWTLHS